MSDAAGAPAVQERVPPMDELELGNHHDDIACLAGFPLDSFPHGLSEIIGRRVMNVKGQPGEIELHPVPRQPAGLGGLDGDVQRSDISLRQP